MDVGVIGGSGYGGAELLRLLEQHPAFKVRVVAAGRSAGQRLSAVFPHLSGTSLAAVELVEPTPQALADCQVVFSATPHSVSLDLLPGLVGVGRTVVDLSGAFRLTPGAFELWYGEEHTAPGLTPAVYGLPELTRDALAGADLIAGPGCYPTAALLALAPLGGLLGDGPITVTGMSGWSGAGRGLRDDLHASHAHANVTAYAAPRHRHTPEIAAQLERAGGAENPLVFIPHLVPMARGMVVTATAPTAVPVARADVHEIVAQYYRDEPFVTALDPGRWPESTQVAGSNAAHVGVAVDERAGVVIASCALDNLVKGAAGQAIQAANVAAGISETAGLPIAGLYP
ncbi:MAG TPA: N-acetyl-gamma-glutamyl-phosphate reductase [Euzebyales bacterium]|nr:N-acetyl-gamma-glutamyl-phosphate reductase [Euzebyales bacterium]